MLSRLESALLIRSRLEPRTARFDEVLSQPMGGGPRMAVGRLDVFRVRRIASHLCVLCVLLRPILRHRVVLALKLETAEADQDESRESAQRTQRAEGAFGDFPVACPWRGLHDLDLKIPARPCFRDSIWRNGFAAVYNRKRRDSREFLSAFAPWSMAC